MGHFLSYGKLDGSSDSRAGSLCDGRLRSAAHCISCSGRSSSQTALPAQKHTTATHRAIHHAHSSAHPRLLQHLHHLALSLLAPVGINPGAKLGLQDKKEDKDKPALSGSWTLKGTDHKIEFCDKNILKVYAHNGSLIVVCEYTRAKDGLVKAKITGLEGTDDLKEKAKTKLPNGLEFRFQWKAKGDTAMLEDLKGDNVDGLKAHIEGEYEKEKSK